ncbi:hypothetical protein TKK_0000398 [Trichogramma kaykai]
MLKSPPSEIREKKRNLFTKTFIEHDDWQCDDLVAFIVVEFDGGVEDINWILKTALEGKKWPYKIVKLLMENGTKLQVLNDLDQTAIHIAAKHQDWSTMGLLLEYSGGENISDKQGFSYLHAACMSGCYDTVQKYIRNGVDINCVFNEDGIDKTPLTLALEFDQIYIAKLLLDKGADLELVHDWGKAPLGCLKCLDERDNKKRLDLLKLVGDHYLKGLLKRKIDSGVLENHSDDEGFTYLHAACMYGQIKIVQKFIDQKDNLDLIWRRLDSSNESPLTLATKYNEIKIVQLLLKNGADPNLKLLGKNPLHLFFNGFFHWVLFEVPVDCYTKLLELFISYKCDVNAKDQDGRSPLFLCLNNLLRIPYESCCTKKAMSTAIKNLEILLRNNADINEVFNSGYDVVKDFLKYGDILISDVDAMCTFLSILDLLKSKGYKINGSSSLMVLKFLLDAVSPDNAHNYNRDKFKNAILFDSSNQIRWFLEKERYDYSNQYYYNRYYCGFLYEHFVIVEKGKMFMTEERMDILKRWEQFYIAKNEEIDDSCMSGWSMHGWIASEIDSIKKMMIKNGVSLLDVCASAPKKGYELLKNSEFRTVINSDDFKENCRYSSETIKGYIIKCLLRKIYEDTGLEYMMLLLHGRLPLLCCEKVIKHLSNEEILLICKMAIHEI